MLSKKIISLGACILLLLSASSPAFASSVTQSSVSSPPITVLFVYINTASSTLTISNGNATIRGYVQKTPSGNSIELTSTLELYSAGSWYAVESWSTYSTSSSALISETYQVSKGTYRVATDYTVNGASNSESGTVYSKTVTY